MVLCVTVVLQWLYSACDKSSEQNKDLDIEKVSCSIPELVEKYCDLFMEIRRELSREINSRSYL
jgi:hypothetical protein